MILNLILNLDPKMNLDPNQKQNSRNWKHKLSVSINIPQKRDKSQRTTLKNYNKQLILKIKTKRKKKMILNQFLIQMMKKNLFSNQMKELHQSINLLLLLTKCTKFFLTTHKMIHPTTNHTITQHKTQHHPNQTRLNTNLHSVKIQEYTYELQYISSVKLRKILKHWEKL